jgi:hypothetical protein
LTTQDLRNARIETIVYLECGCSYEKRSIFHWIKCRIDSDYEFTVRCSHPYRMILTNCELARYAVAFVPSVVPDREYVMIDF